MQSEVESTLQYCYQSDTCYGAKLEGFEDKAVTKEKCCGQGGGSFGVSGTDHCFSCPQDGELGTCHAFLCDRVFK